MKPAKTIAVLILSIVACFVLVLTCGGLMTFGDGVADGINQSTQAQGDPNPTSDDPSTPYENDGEPTPNVEFPPPDNPPDDDDDGEDDGDEDTCSPVD